MTTKLRLRDCRAIADLELKAVLFPELGDGEVPLGQAAAIDALYKAAFGVTLDEVEDAYSDLSDEDMDRVDEFDEAAQCWDFTDKYGHPLRVSRLISFPLAMAALGFAGRLPSTAPDPEAWGAGLAAEAAKFRPKRPARPNDPWGKGDRRG